MSLALTGTCINTAQGPAGACHPAADANLPRGGSHPPTQPAFNNIPPQLARALVITAAMTSVTSS
jgi:hypothetical protein